MIKEKILKIALASTCIASLILPHTSVVLATLTNDVPNDINTVKLNDTPYHERGWAYKMGGDQGTKILKIYNVDDKDEDGNAQYSDEFYCLDATKSFPSGWDETYKDGIDYKRAIPDFFHIDLDETTLSNLSDENYNSLCWLLNNLYLNKQLPETQRENQRKMILNAAFQSIIENTEFADRTTLEDIEAKINEDDIEIIQQWAIWYFTNHGDKTHQEIPIVNEKDGQPVLPVIDYARLPQLIENDGDSMQTSDPTKYEWITILYQYYVKEALKNKNTEFSTNKPSVTNRNATIVEEENNYKAGPFQVNIPAGINYQISVTDENGRTISNYTTDKAQNSQIPTDNTEFYLYIPKNSISDIHKMTLTLNYYETKASVWTPADGNNDNQPMVLVTRENESIPVEAIRVKTKADLALRKYIVAKNNESITDRKPTIQVTDDGKIEYKHKKSPLEVKVGDTVTYEITIYNEGEEEGTATKIVDYLPAGLELAKDNQINSNNGWRQEGNAIITEKLAGEKIAPYDAQNKNLDARTLQIVCEVTNSISGSVLTNIAEIKEDNIKDDDSTPGTIKGSVNSDYKGNNSNPNDLTNPNYYYKGQEDDDDFEKIIVAGRPFDLSLQKFITKVNGKALNESREPKTNTTPLKNGANDAEYAPIIKTPVLVQKGDIVTYTIRVYNEGEVAGYAKAVADYLPEGLGFLVNYKGNIDNSWALPTDTKFETVKLNTLTNAMKNLSVDDFENTTDLANVDVVKGKVKLTSEALKSKLINAFDGSDKLDYKDIEVTCVVLSDNNLRNIAEITQHSDKDGNPITDRDSTPDTVNPDNYPGDDEKQDDNDYENLTVQKFDLSLQKFITGLNNKEITDRIPKINYTDGKITYEHPQTPLEVNNGDDVTYTIRVYNEGEVDGYAAEIGDDIPNGLVFDSENEINKKYGWVMYDANGNVTTDSSKAIEIRTDYLSKEKSEQRGESALLKAFDSQSGNLYYLDVKAVFKVKATSQNDTIINTAEITKDTDKDGNEIDDIDSTPDNKKEGEDDLDKERIHVGYFDLALQKDLTKAVITEGDKTKEIVAVNGQLTKVEINRKKINSTIVKFVYDITITNEGTIAGYAKEIKDYIPEGLQFVEADDPNWKAGSDRTITTEALANKLLQPGESASVQVTLRWINGENNLGLKNNIAEISKDYNEAGDVDDIDSTPNNKVDGEDDIDDAPVILSISTGKAPVYIILTTTILTIIGTGIVAIKKYVL